MYILRTIALSLAITPRSIGCATGVQPSTTRPSEMQSMFAVREQSRSLQVGLASTCIEHLRVRSGRRAPRSARPRHSCKERYRTMDVWTPSQERRGLCQEPATALGFEPNI